MNSTIDFAFVFTSVSYETLEYSYNTEQSPSMGREKPEIWAGIT